MCAIADQPLPPAFDDRVPDEPLFDDPSLKLWQTAILAIGRRVAAAVGSTDRLAADATSALAESLNFAFCGTAEPGPSGEMELSLTALEFGLKLPTEHLTSLGGPQESLIALALESECLVYAPDLATETRATDALLRRCQARAAIACPLRSNGYAYGAILLGSLHPRELDSSELTYIETICCLIGAALARSQMERLLEQANISVKVLESVDAPVVVLDSNLRLMQINRSCEELTGFLPSDVHGRKFCGSFVRANEEAIVDRAFEKLTNDGAPQQFEVSLLRKKGEELRVQWRFRRLANNREGLIVGTAIDITAKCELEAKIARLEQAAAKPVAVPGPPAASAQDGVERRQFPRRPYPYIQRMAPVRNGQMPPLKQFVGIECRDISAGGFSYYCQAKPTDSEVVVAFGADGMETFLVARIMNVRLAVRDGKKMFVVGCQYSCRHKYVGA